MTDDIELMRRIWVDGIDCCDCSDVCSDEGDDKVNFTFEIPGVKKEDIDLKIIPDGLRLSAKRDKNTEYVSEYAFMCPADPDHVKAEYREGVLEVEVPTKCKDPFVDGKKIVLA